MANDGGDKLTSMDLIENILLCLPAESLLRCRAVCRSWNDLISSPLFIKSHRQRSMDSPSQLLFFYRPKRLPYIYDHIRPYALLRMGDGRFETEWVADLRAHFLICSCDDLILCLGFRRQLLLWNPSRGKLTRVYSPYVQVLPGMCGICRDRLNDDYKIVVIECGVCYGIYSCNAKSWTTKDLDFDSDDEDEDTTGPFPDRAGLCVDEAVYWIRITDDGDGIQEIVYFDSRDDKLKLMERPQGLEDNISLLSFKDTLTACFYNVRDSLLQIWGRNGTSWTEFMSIRLAPTPFPFLTPLYFQENMILMQVDTARFLIYHPIEKTFQEFEDESLGEVHGIIPYVDTLFFISLERDLHVRKHRL